MSRQSTRTVSLLELYKAEDHFFQAIGLTGRSQSRFLGVRIASTLIDWLNYDRISPDEILRGHKRPNRRVLRALERQQRTKDIARRRVTNLLGLIAEYRQAAVNAQKEMEQRWGQRASVHDVPFYWEGRTVYGDLDWPSAFSEVVNNAAAKVSAAMRRYSLHPDLAFGKGLRLLFAWTAREGSLGSAPDFYEFSFTVDGNQRKDARPFDEASAITRIIALCHEGLIDRLRRCKFCGRWFYAKFSHSKFCTTQCQQKSYRSSPEWKEHRKQYMKDLREKHKRKGFEPYSDEQRRERRQHGSKQ